MAQVIDMAAISPALLIAAHGDAGGRARNTALRDLVRTVRERLPALQVACGVLNGKPSLEAAFAGLRGDKVLVYPLFMSGGYYVEKALPERLGLDANSSAGSRDVTILPPLGLDPALPEIVARRVRDAAPANPYSASESSVLVIAHGSTKSPQSRLAAETFADRLRRHLKAGLVRTAYLEEAPFVEDATAGLTARSVVVSLFVSQGSHGGGDVPKILAEAGIGYAPVIGPVGADRQIADLVVAAVRRELPGELRAA